MLVARASPSRIEVNFPWAVSWCATSSCSPLKSYEELFSIHVITVFCSSFFLNVFFFGSDACQGMLEFVGGRRFPTSPSSTPRGARWWWTFKAWAICTRTLKSTRTTASGAHHLDPMQSPNRDRGSPLGPRRDLSRSLSKKPNGAVKRTHADRDANLSHHQQVGSASVTTKAEPALHWDPATHHCSVRIPVKVQSARRCRCVDPACCACVHSAVTDLLENSHPRCGTCALNSLRTQATAHFSQPRDV